MREVIVVPISRGCNKTSGILKFVVENLDKEVIITTQEELKHVLDTLVDSVEPYNVKINKDLIKETEMGVITI